MNEGTYGREFSHGMSRVIGGIPERINSETNT